MDNTQRLALLKAHKLNLSGGAVFEGHQHCVEWVNRVAPLLRYDDEHHQEFMQHAQVMLPEQISVARRMTHIRALAGIVDRAIIELENGIVTQRAEDKTPKESNGKANPIEPSWHKSTFGKILLEVGISLIIILIIFAIEHWLGLELK
jgi:hypothetical protein